MTASARSGPDRSPARAAIMTGERARLTALCCAMLLTVGGGLIVLVYVFVGQNLYRSIHDVTRAPVTNVGTGAGWGDTTPRGQGTQIVPGISLTPSVTRAQDARTQRLAASLRSATARELAAAALVGLAALTAVSVPVAWWTAGRVLRPVRQLTETARRLTCSTLHERIALRGPSGELKVLADTFDEMLDRLENQVEAQKRFAANAAHELRTPLALQRVAAEVGLAGAPDRVRVARVRAKLVETAKRQEDLIEGLLLLAASERELQRRTSVDLRDLAQGAVDTVGSRAAERGVCVRTELRALPAVGDPVLLDRLTQNLVGNAVRYNHPGGEVRVRTGASGLEVSNTGPVVPEGTVALLFEPFRRLQERRHLPGEGVGLGLSIVSAIARAHGFAIEARANSGGGLTIRVSPGSERRPHTRSAQIE
ncbi:HAMP domain-containing sensor histidine kinase (plasmid) [Streptomyces sp. HUAS 31]|uniref:sensor histidine kinase n=1 Tax=Streptomyces sp. HUAS 31 TaxID=3020055 RepID=UPI0023065D43|nr:HAMP domain-containing sensor histidine kinase [Streptomyces sp. HUAS 31]WCE02435.1 HAMP domain-containing sensor histidine kinase [Streptomyces sp. HUAS 31]